MAQRLNTPSWKVSTVLMLVNRLKSANHNPKLENRSALDLVEATSSHHNGNRKYATQSSTRTVSSQLVLLLAGARRACGSRSSAAPGRTDTALAGLAAVMSGAPFVVRRAGRRRRRS